MAPRTWKCRACKHINVWKAWSCAECQADFVTDAGRDVAAAKWKGWVDYGVSSRSAVDAATASSSTAARK
eukprot:6475869-Karenia_brevis.AAC.1